MKKASKDKEMIMLVDDTEHIGSEEEERLHKEYEELLEKDPELRKRIEEIEKSQ